MNRDTTLADLSQEQYEQLISVDIFPAIFCPACGGLQAVNVHGRSGSGWMVSCGSCRRRMAPQKVTLATVEQLAEVGWSLHGGHGQHDGRYDS